MVLSRFGISLGFGDKSIEEVCREQDIDCNTFLTVANYISGYPYNNNDINLEQLITYLKSAHSYFLDFQLPMIRRKLLEAIDISSVDSIGFLILKFYDDYATEVRTHMEVENDHIFPYVESLLDGSLNKEITIDSYAKSHTHIAPKLKELKDIIVRYYPEKGNDLLTSALFDIITCEQDLRAHCKAEEDLFIPAVTRLEKKIEQEEELRSQQDRNTKDEKSADNDDTTPTDEEKLSSLSDREREIVKLIAKGLTNKEIANQLYLSIHTVATHRRNISGKLQIHSSAGLTIFAIVNGLLPLNEIPRDKIQ
jgi:regulator of cell morphogenesis and NO signaling